LKMNNNAMATIIFCSHLCVGENVTPFETNEWNQFVSLLKEKELDITEIFNYCTDDFKDKLSLENEQIERIERLIARGASIAFELEKLSQIGINIITRSEIGYPEKIRRLLGKNSPPLMYYVGNLELAAKPLIGVVGARSVEQEDIDFTTSIVRKAVEKGYGIVSGGAKGIDSISSKESLRNGGFAVEYISDSLIQKIKNTDTINAVRNGNLLILSALKPDAGFNAGFAMMRNKYIYANSVGTVVVRSDFNKGGTWAGAIENLKKNWTNEYCWNNNLYAGNIELINRGAIPIDISWNLDLSTAIKEKAIVNKQISLFD